MASIVWCSGAFRRGLSCHGHCLETDSSAIDHVHQSRRDHVAIEPSESRQSQTTPRARVVRRICTATKGASLRFLQTGLFDALTARSARIRVSACNHAAFLLSEIFPIESRDQVLRH